MPPYSATMADPGLYGPHSVAWRINRERAIQLTGARALLMQLAHPAVAAGVAEHSDFKRRPLRRLARTITLSLDGVFGDTRTALNAVRVINARHAGVRGPAYDAMDPRLLAWVLATLVDSAVLGYELYVGPLAEEEKDAFLGEELRVARYLGMPESALPRGFAGLRRYVDAMIATGEVRVDDTARDLARWTLYPPRARFLRPALDFAALLTIVILPAPLRHQYGFAITVRQRATFALLRHAVRRIVPLLPRALREVPQAREARRWIA